MSKINKDNKGHKITTHEGFSGYVHPDVENYFVEKYNQASFKVVPGHWPSMESEKDVDDWIDSMEKLTNMVFD